MKTRTSDLLQLAVDVFRGTAANPPGVESREALVATGKHILANLIQTNLKKHRQMRSKKGIADWTFTKAVAGIPMKTTDRLTYGNIKLKGILVWDLPAVTTCPACEDCKGACYAVKAQLLYPMTMLFRWTNLLLYLVAPKWTALQIINQIEKRSHGYNHLRIHASGDFFDQEYVLWWAGIVAHRGNRCPPARTPGFESGRRGRSGAPESLASISHTAAVRRDQLHGAQETTGSKEAAAMLAEANAAAGTPSECPATKREGIKCERSGGEAIAPDRLTHRYTVFVRH